MSLNKYNSSTGVLENIASGQRVVIYTKAAYEAAKQAGTLPADTLVMITDDVKEGGGFPLLDFDNAIELSTTELTTTSDGAIIGELRSGTGTQQKLYINNNVRKTGSGSSSDAQDCVIYGIPAGSKLKLESAQYTPCVICFVPYKSED